jgi:predicted RNA-binding Zn ribbon-like protein
VNNRLPTASVPHTTSDDQALLLDVLNSTPVIDGVPTDALATWTAAREWMARRAIPVSTTQWRVLVEVRDLLQSVVRGEAPAAELGRVLSEVRYRADVDEAGIAWHVEAPRNYEVAARCILAWDGLQRADRLRPCANSECRMFLIDRSKPNTARWCSMAVCGNRMKARRFQQRQQS